MAPDPRAIHHDIPLPPDDTVEAILDSNISNTGDEIPYLVHLEPTQPTPLTDANTVYNHFDADYQCSHIEKVLSIENNPSTGTLFVKVLWKNQQESFLPIDVLKEEQPFLLAQYIFQHPVEHTRSGFWNIWAHTAQREISSVQRKLRRIYSNITHEHSFFPYSRRTIHCKKEYQSHMQSYLGVEIPRTVKEAYTLDDKNKNQLWKEAIQREKDSTQEYRTFEFLPPGSDVPSGYQLALLKMVFDVKSDLRQKARLVVGGHKVNADEHTSFSSVV
jgi:transposase